MGSRKCPVTEDEGRDMATRYATAVRLEPVKRAKVPDATAPKAVPAVEPAVKPAVKPEVARYRLRLFVTGTTPRSARAIQNLRAICEEHLQSRYDLEVIDIYQHPEHVTAEQIVVTPTLVKQSPLPLRKLIGDLSDTARVLAALDIAPDLPSATLRKNTNAA
jgi:circadian clock protein KaiB